MKYLANENFPGPVVIALRALGNDVAWIAEDMRAASDKAVLKRAVADKRVLLTFDKDFGELAFKAALPAHCGIVLFRLSGESPADDNARAIAALTSRDDWAGNFSVVQDDRIRIRSIAGVE
jgi:predicted nuclease of predicted toxin-antitoxin system